MYKIKLELESFKILKRKEHWNLYFIFLTEDDGKTIVTVFPAEGSIPLRKDADNFHSFKPKGVNTEGLCLLEREIEKNASLKIRLNLMHSRKGLRNVGELIEDISQFLDKEKLLLKNFKPIKSISPHWLIIDKSLDIVTNILKNTKDKDLGLLNMDEDFEDELESQNYLERSNTVSSGIAELVWGWKIKKQN